MKVITFTLVLLLVFSVMAGAIEEGQTIELKMNESIHSQYRFQPSYVNFGYAGIAGDGIFSLAVRTSDAGYNLFYLIDNRKFKIRFDFHTWRKVITCKLLKVTPDKIRFEILSIE